MKHFDADKVLEKYVNGTASPTERATLERWHLQWEPKTEHAPLEQLVKDQVRSRKLLVQYTLGKQPVKLWPRIAAAASVVIMLGVGFYFYQGQQKVQQQSVYVNDIAPGSNKAYLTLANGTKISLNDASKGKLAEQEGVQVSKIGEGQVVYDVKGSTSEKVVYNTITTPLGGQYQVNLPDGTRVWLNAGSSLKFPTTFANLKDRSVELSGEGYFEVFKDKQHPFIVNTDQQRVQVLGTHFNINSYADEGRTKTTLLEGSVKVSPLLVSLSSSLGNPVTSSPGSPVTSSPGSLSSLRGGTTKQSSLPRTITLIPGQQSVLTQQELAVHNVDLNETIAWKQGVFWFNDEGIESVMRKLSRWYNIEVIYNRKMAGETFTGKLSRYNNISQVLKALESTKTIHFKVEGRRVTIM